MNETTPTNTETAQHMKAPAKPTKPAANKVAHIPAIKATPINPAWATEVAKAYFFVGPLADAVAEHLANAVALQLVKVTRPDKLTKLVKEAVNKSIGKVG